MVAVRLHKLTGMLTTSVFTVLSRDGPTRTSTATQLLQRIHRKGRDRKNETVHSIDSSYLSPKVLKTSLEELDLYPQCNTVPFRKIPSHDSSWPMGNTRPVTAVLTDLRLKKHLSSERLIHQPLKICPIFFHERAHCSNQTPAVRKSCWFRPHLTGDDSLRWQYRKILLTLHQDFKNM